MMFLGASYPYRASVTGNLTLTFLGTKTCFLKKKKHEKNGNISETKLSDMGILPPLLTHVKITNAAPKR